MVSPPKKGYYELEGADPHDPCGSLIPMFLSKEDLRGLYKHHPIKADNLKPAAEVLEAPDRIYVGIREDQGRWGYCYVGTPEQHAISNGVYGPIGRNRVFCVFVTDRLVVFEWRVERAERVGVGSTLNVRGADIRFEELLWDRRTKKP